MIYDQGRRAASTASCLQLQKQLEEEEKIAEEKKESSLLRDRVTDEEIARIVARWTGIPVSKLVEGEREKLLRLPDMLHQRVIGQDEAVQKVSEAILRSRAGHRRSEPAHRQLPVPRPHRRRQDRTGQGAGPGAVRRREEHGAYRHDRVHGEVFSVSRLIGAPPGYVGYEEGGQLTEAVRRQPVQRRAVR